MNQAACTPLYKTHRYITPQKLGEVWKIRFFSASFRRFLGGEKNVEQGEGRATSWSQRNQGIPLLETTKNWGEVDFVTMVD